MIRFDLVYGCICIPLKGDLTQDEFRLVDHRGATRCVLKKSTSQTYVKSKTSDVFTSVEITTLFSSEQIQRMETVPERVGGFRRAVITTSVKVHWNVDTSVVRGWHGGAPTPLVLSQTIWHLSTLNFRHALPITRFWRPEVVVYVSGVPRDLNYDNCFYCDFYDYTIVNPYSDLLIFCYFSNFNFFHSSVYDSTFDPSYFAVIPCRTETNNCSGDRVKHKPSLDVYCSGGPRGESVINRCPLAEGIALSTPANLWHPSFYLVYK